MTDACGKGGGGVEQAYVAAAALVEACRREAEPALRRVDELALANQRRVLAAFWSEQVSAADLAGSTGYGYGDAGRDKLERLYARVFGCDAALVRPQVVSGTHALRLGLFAALRPGQHLVIATGEPYDTLAAVIGLRPSASSLAAWGIAASVVPLRHGQVDTAAVLAALRPTTRAVLFQRSRGYSARPSLSVAALAECFQALKASRPDVALLVDNCYGELVEDREPTHVGADVVMGSLIKNPGAGLAPTGGYVAGRSDLVELAAEQLTAAGIGGEVGPTWATQRVFYQALFLAPHAVAQAVKVNILAAAVLERLGIEVSPRWHEPRTDLILSARFGHRAALLTFCQAVQEAAPVDSFVRLEAAPMAGYEDQVVMAAGTFVQGGSLELTADAPLRPPYIGYLQGGLTWEHGVVALERVVQALLQAGLGRVDAPPERSRAPGDSARSQEGRV
ncbi:MAG: methionine gamma-lyase family protein [Alicyclobacillus sp.]|nr:methionine gamma-lyase family protein [Alicyclobacillus sp.]